MGSDAQFQSLGLRIYITRAEFKELLANTWVMADLWYRKEKITPDGVYVSLTEEARLQLAEWYSHERSLLNEAKRPKQSRLEHPYRKPKKGTAHAETEPEPLPADHVPEVDG